MTGRDPVDWEVMRGMLLVTGFRQNKHNARELVLDSGTHRLAVSCPFGQNVVPTVYAVVRYDGDGRQADYNTVHYYELFDYITARRLQVGI